MDIGTVDIYHRSVPSWRHRLVLHLRAVSLGADTGLLWVVAEGSATRGACLGYTASLRRLGVREYVVGGARRA